MLPQGSPLYGFSQGMDCAAAVANRKMKKNEAIETILALYPPDSEVENVEKIGEKLLQQAKLDTGYHDRWQDLPERVLVRCAELCEQRERGILTWKKTNIMQKSQKK